MKLEEGVTVTNSPYSHASVTIYVPVTVLLYSFHPLTRSLYLPYLGSSFTLRYMPFRLCLDPITFYSCDRVSKALLDTWSFGVILL